MSARKFLITGRVQGVFFRSTTEQKAKELGITGWVRNTDDGAVEIHAEGSKEALKQLEKWCWKGPSAAEVQKVIVKDVPEEGFSDFSIRH